VIRRLLPTDLESVFFVINKVAEAYRGVIPTDRWKEPYISISELTQEIGQGVTFYGFIADSFLVAVMGIQPVNSTTLIRHAYVLPKCQRKGIGRKLLGHLLSLVRTSEVLVGTWEAAKWAICFYENQGFRLVSSEEKDRLLRKYWNIPERQIETSVVLKLKIKN